MILEILSKRDFFIKKNKKMEVVAALLRSHL